jgi:AcrR family transcriptional regulator
VTAVARSSAAEPGVVTRPGRPRRYEEAEELELLLDAAFEVMRRAGYQQVTVNDILTEAGMSTRSFYRHFASKEDLLRGLFRREAEQFATAVTRRVSVARTPVDGLATWTDEILGFGLDRPRARRAAVLLAPDAMRSLDPEEVRRALELLIVPLRSVLADGAADGSFRDIDPEGDASHISALTWETASRLHHASSRAERDALRASFLSFVNRALGTGTVANAVSE